MSSLFSKGSVIKPPDISKDLKLSTPPDDSISSLSWSSQEDLLAVSSWDHLVRIYDVRGKGSTGKGVASINFQAPVLSCDWSIDGQKVVGAGADRSAMLLDIGGGVGAPAIQVAAHDSPIKCVKFFTDPNTNQQMIVTGSWDKTVKFWDLRTDTPTSTLTFDERVYDMDVKNNLLVIATADRKFHIVNLGNRNNVWKTRASPVANQIRSISCYLDSTGFIAGTIEGRCSFQYVHDEDQQKKGYNFRCHRDPASNKTTNIFSINCVSTHPIFGTFSTAGSDGSFQFWDKDKKSRLREYPKLDGPISATAFNSNGVLFAYAVSYDWSKGFMGNTPQHPNWIGLHTVEDEDCKPRPPPTLGRR